MNWVTGFLDSSWPQTYCWWCGFWNPEHGNKKIWNPLAHVIILSPHPNNEQHFSYFLTKEFQGSSLLAALVGLLTVLTTLVFCKNYYCNKGNCTQAKASWSWGPLCGRMSVPTLCSSSVRGGGVWSGRDPQGYFFPTDREEGRGPF